MPARYRCGKAARNRLCRKEFCPGTAAIPAAADQSATPPCPAPIPNLAARFRQKTFIQGKFSQFPPRSPCLRGSSNTADPPGGTNRKMPGRKDCEAEPEPWTRIVTMKALNLFKRFQKDEDGAVTVDWVVLTAAIVGLGLIVMAAIRPAITGLSSSIASEINEADDNF
jgi:Flp pilus assembly pilin Flp